MTKIVNPDDKHVEPEVLAQAIVDVAAGAKKLLGSRLTERAVLVLIQDSITPFIGIREIKAVLYAASQLEDRYIKKAKKS